MLQPLFPIPLGIYKRDIESTKEEYEFVKSRTYSNNLNNYMQKDSRLLLESPELKDIKKFIQKCLDSYVKEVYQSNTKFKISISWANLTEPNQTHHKHNHSNSVFSGVYYFEDLEKSPIYFERPLNQQLSFDITNKDGEVSFNSYNADHYFATEIKAHTCIVFPSVLTHGVEKNISSENRYSIAFNTWFEDNQTIGHDARANSVYL